MKFQDNFMGGGGQLRKNMFFSLSSLSNSCGYMGGGVVIIYVVFFSAYHNTAAVYSRYRTVFACDPFEHLVVRKA